MLQGSVIPPSDCSNGSVIFISPNDTCSTSAQYYLIDNGNTNALINLFNATCAPRFHSYMTACSDGPFLDEVSNVTYILIAFTLHTLLIYDVSMMNE